MRASKARFLAATTHDLRPPFEAMRLGLETLALQGLPPHSRRVLDDVQQASQALGRVMHSVLDTARLEGEIRSVTPRAFALGPMLAQIAREAALLHPTGAVRARSTQAWVVGDPTLTERLLRNLLANAVSACTARGEGDQARVGRVLLAVRPRGLLLRVEVYDSGRGVPEQLMDHLFDDFCSGTPGGLGLGLSLVREIADQLSLQLELRSKPGRGSRFSIGLPLALRSAVPGGPLWTARAAIADRVVAVALREPLHADLLSAVLSDWGLAVMQSADAGLLQQELKQLDCRADVLLSDQADEADLAGEAQPWNARQVLRLESGAWRIEHELARLINALSQRPAASLDAAPARSLWRGWWHRAVAGSGAHAP